MDKLNRINFDLEDEHPPSEMLLQLVDGELPAQVTARIHVHLEACWRCRVMTKKIEEAIEEIISFDEEALKPVLLPPNQWRGFDRQLSRLVAERGRRSMLARIKSLWAMWGRRTFFRSAPRTMPARRPFLKGAVAIAVAVALVMIGERLFREPAVSASELLRSAAEARFEPIRRTDQPVIHQRLRVRRAGAAKPSIPAGRSPAVAMDASAGAADSVDWEVWEEALGARFRQTVAPEAGRQFTPAATDKSIPGSKAAAFLAELTRILRDNRMDPRQPLSPQSFGAWRDSLALKHETVTQSAPNGVVEDLILRTVQDGTVEAGRIAEATMTVRARDRHTTKLRFRVRASEDVGGGEWEYELIETAYEVVSLVTLGPGIFEDRPVASAAPVVASVASPPPPDMGVAPLHTAAEMEVETLRLLNEIGADLGEQVSVSRDAQNRLRVEGIVETAQRKAQILQALAPVIAAGEARVEIQTVAEAVAARKASGGETSTRQARDVIDAPSGVIAAAAELQSYFHGNAEALRFAARMVSRSQEAMRHLYALRQLSARFSPEEARAFDPETRKKWLALLRSHARNYRREIAELRDDLRPIFFPGAIEPPAPEKTEVVEPSEMARLIETLFTLGSGIDRQVLAAFAASSDGAAETMKTPQFRQSLLAAEALAARIQSAP